MYLMERKVLFHPTFLMEHYYDEIWKHDPRRRTKSRRLFLSSSNTLFSAIVIAVEVQAPIHSTGAAKASVAVWVAAYPCGLGPLSRDLCTPWLSCLVFQWHEGSVVSWGVHDGCTSNMQLDPGQAILPVTTTVMHSGALVATRVGQPSPSPTFSSLQHLKLSRCRSARAFAISLLCHPWTSNWTEPSLWFAAVVSSVQVLYFTKIEDRPGLGILRLVWT